MSNSTFLDHSDFIRACKLASDAGFDVRAAKFDGAHFGYWSFQLFREGMRPRSILWEARDCWVIVQREDPDGVWRDEWIVKEPTHDSPAEILARLGQLSE